MFDDVAQRRLDDAENAELDVARYRWHGVVGELHEHAQLRHLTALTGDRADQAERIQLGRMQPVRERMQLAGDQLAVLPQMIQDGGDVVRTADALPEIVQPDGHERHPLADAVVQIARDAAPLLLLGGDQFSAQLAERLLRIPLIGEIDRAPQISGERSVDVVPRDALEGDAVLPPSCTP